MVPSRKPEAGGGWGRVRNCSFPCSFFLLTNNYLLSTYYGLGTEARTERSKLDSIASILEHIARPRRKPG
jgi:hypothetical protein